MNINWTVNASKIDKQARKLRQTVLLSLKLLFKDLANSGPALSAWTNYGKLQGQKGDNPHCHPTKGQANHHDCKNSINTRTAGEIFGLCA